MSSASDATEAIVIIVGMLTAFVLMVFCCNNCCKEQETRQITRHPAQHPTIIIDQPHDFTSHHKIIIVQ